MNKLVLLLLLLLILIIFYINYKSKLTKSGISKNINIIVSRYNENLKWMNDKPFNEYKYIIYNKGTNNNFEKKYAKEINNIKNVGKCDHTYLYYIYHNYNKLDDITIFLPGCLNKRYKYYKAKRLLNNINKYNKAIFLYDYKSNDISKDFYYFKVDNYISDSIENRNTSDMKLSNIRPYGLWYETNFNFKINHFVSHGIFSISKKDILKYDKTHYYNFMKNIENHENPELGHYYEKSWEAIFYPFNDTKLIFSNNYINFFYSYFESIKCRF